MGMYNEVHKECESCGVQLTKQISQIVYGFGEFRLDSPDDISRELHTYALKRMFVSEVNNLMFQCECGWNYWPKVQIRDDENEKIIYI